jgi:hypothetical protein
VAPDVLNPDPAFQVNSDPDTVSDPGFDDQKIEEKNTAEKLTFLSNIAVYLNLGLHKGYPSNRRSLKPSTEKIQHFKK